MVEFEEDLSGRLAPGCLAEEEGGGKERTQGVRYDAPTRWVVDLRRSRLAPAQWYQKGRGDGYGKSTGLRMA